MKNLKKIVALLMVATMVFSVLAGCGTSKENSPATSAAATAPATVEATSTAPAPDPLADPMEISFAMWDIGQAIVDGQPDAVREQLYKDLNITIKPVNVTWDDYMQKIQVWAASAQLPDIFAVDVVGTQNYKNWIDQGIVQSLPDDLSAYPDLQKRMNGSGMEIYKYPVNDPNGKFYAIPRISSFSADEWATNNGIMLRKDWMANVGITKEPENMDEFITLMKAFVENDPDKNNKKDTIGLTCYNADWLTWFFAAYEPGMIGGAGNWVRDTENPGKWIPAFMTKNALEGMKALKKLYDAGGLDKDFAALKGEEGEDKFASSKAGAYAHDVTPATLKYLGEKYVKNYPDKKYEDAITILKPFKNVNDGQYYRMIANPAWSETYVNATVDAKKVDRIMRLFDYVIGDKGYNLIHFGIEGTDWKKEGDKVVLTPQKDAAGAIIPITTIYPFTKAGFIAEWSGTHQFTNPSATPELQKMSKDLNDWLMANAKAQPIDLRLPLFDVPDKDKATVKFGEIAIKSIMSKDIDKTFNDMVSEFRANGYDKLIDEVNAECAKLNIK